MVHGLNEGHIAPYTDIEVQLTKYHTYIIMKSQDKSLQLIFEEHTNEDNMDDIRQELNMMKCLIGKVPGNPLPAEANANYNNRISSGVGKSPYQAGTQVTLIVAENLLTPSKKLLPPKPTANYAAARADNDTLHNEDCTANQPMDASIGNECDWTEATEPINASGIQTGELTIDGDSSLLLNNQAPPWSNHSTVSDIWIA